MENPQLPAGTGYFLYFCILSTELLSQGEARCLAGTERCSHLSVGQPIPASQSKAQYSRLTGQGCEQAACQHFSPSTFSSNAAQ